MQLASAFHKTKQQRTTTELEFKPVKETDILHK